jgi:hypothetical protein
MRSYLKNTQHNKRVKGVAQAVEHLLRGCEALISNPSTTKKKVVDTDFLN